MNTKVIQAFRIPSLLLAAVLQFMPMVRAALPAMQSASNILAIIFRWGGVAAAALGSVQAVSGASTAITLGNVTTTNGVATTNKLLTSPQTAGWWSVSGTPPGIGLIGSGSSSKLGGVPTATGVYSVILVAKSSASANASETTSKTIVYTVVANTGGGGGGGASNSPPVASAQSVSTAEDAAKAITLTGSDPDGNALTYSVVVAPVHGALSGTAPIVTYTPTANYNGADSFTFQVNDGTNNSTAATVSITVTTVNDAPVASAQSVTTPEDTAKPITLSGSDVDGNALTYAVVAAPAHGSLSGTAPNVTYTPVANYNGSDSFTFKVNDGTVDSATATVLIAVSAVNDAPVANALTVTTDKNVALAITLTGGDADGNALTFAVVTQPTKGALTGTAPNLTYTPNNNVTGSDSFTFKANDGTVDSAVATVSITIAAGPNTAPVATAQSVTTAEDIAAPITLSGTDADANALTYVIVTTPTHGSLSGTAPNVTYAPAANYNGSDSFTFRINDGITNSAVATISITVSAVNDAPVASAQSASTPEDAAKAITLSGSDVDGNTLTYTVVASPTHGTLSGAAPNVTYTPATNYNGADSFTFKVNDGTVDSTPATVSITVAAVNDAPVAIAQSVTTVEDTAKPITLSGSDVDGNALTYVVVASPTHGTLSGTAPNVTYTPAANYNGADGFTFKANDGTIDSATATISITVTAVNDAPVATAQSVATDKNVAKSVTLAGTDVDGNALTFAVVAQPTRGVLSGTSPNLTYTPNNNVAGADSFTFKVNDGTVDSATVTVAINITSGPNTAPIATAQSVTVNEDATMLITFAGTDAEGDLLSYTVVTSPAHGTLSGTAPALYYKPATNYNGSDTLWFKVNDGTVDSVAAVVSITVTPVNDAPVANVQNISTDQDTAKAITFSGSDVDGDALTFTVTTAPAHGTLSGTAPNFIYAPDADYSGSDTIWFKVNDGTADSALAVVSLAVTAVATPATNLPIVSVIAGANAAEPKKVGNFLFTRVGNSTKALTLFFTLDGTAVLGADYSNPGNKVTIAAGKTNATLLIKPIADKIFEGAKTVVLSLVDSTNFDTGEQDSAAILIGDDDRPRITITTPRPATDDADGAARITAARVPSNFQTKVYAAAYTGFNLLLQCSPDMTNWTVVAAPPLEQPIDYMNFAPTGAQTCFYRVIYIRGAVTEASIAEALAHQMFSANLVGVVNVLIQPGWNLAANPLNGLAQDGPLGDLPDGMVFVRFKSNKANTYEEGKWSRGVPLARSTTGGWLYNPSNAPVNVAYVGEVPTLASKPQLPAGWSVRSSVTNTVVGPDNLLGYPLHAGDALYEFNPLGMGTDMWITHLRGAEGWDNPPGLAAGQGALIYKTKSTRATVFVVPAPPTPNQIKFVPVNDN